MIQTKYDWQLAHSIVDESFEKLAKKEGFDHQIAALLYERGIQTQEELQQFLNPQLEDLHDPYLLHDMQKAVERIRMAIEQGERILLYGDYDADGMTSASILKEALEELGAECIVYLPNRFTDGYGPNQSIYHYYIHQEEVSLIVTVDNGVAGHEAIAYAQSQGVDVIVTDHHSLPATLPNAYAIIHPEHPEGQYSFPYLAGCGVAFKVACALLGQIQIEWLDLVAIGTIADMVSLTDENRAMVQIGLSLLKQTERIGLQELLDIIGIDKHQLDEETVGFQIAPRLNALGRLEDPNPAVELLTGFDETECQQIAFMIDQKNTERKQIVQTIYEEASLLVNPERKVQVIAKEGWNPGVLGIVAGRLLEELHQPVIVLSIKDGIAKGSARSIEAVNIFEAFSGHRELFVAFGGHAGAAGMTVTVEQLDAVALVLEQYIDDQQIDIHQKNQLKIDAELDLEELSLEKIKSLNRLKPFGMNSSKPLFYLKEVQVESARVMGQGNQHLKLRIKKGKVAVDVLAFYQGEFLTEFSQAKHLEMVVSLSVNQWNGNTTLQLLLEDARVQGVQLYDLRSRQVEAPSGVPEVSFDKEHPEVISSKEIVIGRISYAYARELKEYIQKGQFEAIYFKNECTTPYYLHGYGSREQFTKLYKALYQFKELDVRYKLKELSHYLRIETSLLIKMIQIFEELEFVNIEDGLMTVNLSASKRSIEDSHIYQEFKQEVFFQERMALGTPEDIYQWLLS